MGGCIFIDPIFLFPRHPAMSGNFARRTCSVETADLGTVAKRFGAISLLLRIPMVDCHLDRHLATPDTRTTLGFIGSGVKSTMSPLSIHLERERWPSPGWAGALRSRLARDEFQTARLVVTDDLHSAVGNGRRGSAHHVAGLKLMLCLRGLANLDGELSDTFPHQTAQGEGIAQIRVASLVKGAQ